MTSQCQTTLKASISHQPCVPPFSTQGLIDYIIELVISEDDAFQLLDRPAEDKVKATLKVCSDTCLQYEVLTALQGC